jgi:hypothetical protein
MSLESLKAEYDTVKARIVTETDTTKRQADLNTLMDLQMQIATELHGRLRSNDVPEKVDVLLKELATIQYQYNQMLISTDKMETLRRFHEQQVIPERVYFLAFGVLCILLVGVMLR